MATGQHKLIKEMILRTIDDLLRLGASYRIYQFVENKNVVNWRDLEDELHVRYPVKAIGIIADRTNLGDHEFFHGEEDISPSESVSQYGRLPIEAALASHAFTMMEVCGNDVVGLLTPANSKKWQGWHRDIKQLGEGEISKNESTSKFANVFGVPEKDISPLTVTRLRRIKRVRNDFAHSNPTAIDFEEFLKDIIAIICQIYFALLPSEKEIKMYPYEDFNGKWQNPSDGKRR